MPRKTHAFSGRKINAYTASFRAQFDVVNGTNLNFTTQTRVSRHNLKCSKETQGEISRVAQCSKEHKETAGSHGVSKETQGEIYRVAQSSKERKETTGPHRVFKGGSRRMPREARHFKGAQGSRRVTTGLQRRLQSVTFKFMGRYKKVS